MPYQSVLKDKDGEIREGRFQEKISFHLFHGELFYTHKPKEFLS
jgi:hypothetical protein